MLKFFHKQNYFQPINSNEKTKISFLSLSIEATLGSADFHDRQMGMLTPWSHVPNRLVTYSDNMSFKERWYNSLLSTCEWLVRKYIYFPRQNAIAQQHFGHLGLIPTVEELTQNISLVFVNTHRSVQAPRPSMPGMIYVGGAHIEAPKSLPKDLQQFLDEAEHGVIYFSLGTILKTSRMPRDKLQIVLGKTTFFCNCLFVIVFILFVIFFVKSLKIIIFIHQTL